MTKFAFKFLAGLAVCVTVSLSANAGIITYSAPVDLFAGGNNDMFVNTNGTGVVALNFGGPTETLNGVTFGAATNVAVGSGGGITQNGVTVTALNSGNGANLGTTNNAFQDGEFFGLVNVDNLLQSGLFNPSVVTLSGLAAGTTYELQGFFNDSRGNRNANFQTGLTDGGTTIADIAGIVQLNHDGSDGATAVGSGFSSGESIVGTFVADATGTQSFNIFGRNNIANDFGGAAAQINALQLREVAVVAAIPEPSSVILLTLGAFGLIGSRRRK